jgi:competence protein ComEC
MKEILSHRHPAIMGACIAAGVWLYPHFPPQPGALAVSIAALGLIGLVASITGSRLSWLPVYAGLLLVGAWSCARLPEPAMPSDGWLVGDVLQVSGRRALVGSNAGRVELSFGGAVPQRGQQIAAWYRRSSMPQVLEGGPDPSVSLRRARATSRRVRSWEPIGSAGKYRKAPERFSFAANGGLLWALVSGDRSHIPETDVQTMRNSGVSHLLAISGMHIGLVAGMAWLAMRAICTPLVFSGHIRMALWIPATVAVLAAGAYGDLVGWPPSAQRAAIMVAAASLAQCFGRRADPWNLLGTSCGLILLSEPAEFNSLGFQLSFTAISGILLISPRFARLLPPDTPRMAIWVVSSIGASFGAVAGTLPVAALHFQSLAPAAPLANLFAVPLLAVVAVPSSLLGLALPMPLALVPLCVGDSAAAAAFALLGLLPACQWHPAVSPLAAAALLPLPFLRKRTLVMLVLYLSLLLKSPGLPSMLRVTFLAVGQGDAALVEWPDGRRWLVDGGPPSRRILGYLRRKGIRLLDAVFISHPHPDHFGGLHPVAEEIQVGTAWAPRPPGPGEESYSGLWSRLVEGGAVPGYPGDPLGEGAELLHPLDGWHAAGGSRVNEESLVLRFGYGERRFLFTGDIGAQAEAKLAATIGRSDVLKVAHHGSRTSSSRAFAAAVRPELAIVTCGIGNRYGHPHPESIDAWSGAKLLRTDLHGSLEISTDGIGLYARSWLPGRGWQRIPLAK